jgi:hypothetical protein
MLELIQVIVYAGLINAPNSGQLIIFMTYFFRVVSFNVAWTFMDGKLPLISPEPLSTEISFNIRSLSLHTHPVNNLLGTLIFLAGVFLIVALWPFTER